MKKLAFLLLVVMMLGMVGCAATTDPYAGMDYCDRPDVDKYKDPQCLGGRDIIKPVK